MIFLIAFLAVVAALGMGYVMGEIIGDILSWFW